MRRLSLAVLSTVAFALTAPTASAMPAASAPAASSPLAMPVAMGCGPGRSRDAMGLCRHRFNRFEHHGHFRAYKRRHCTEVSTPNGMVKRCRL